VFTQEFQQVNMQDKLQIREWDSFDVGFINQWLAIYHMDQVTVKDLPKIGFVAFVDQFRMGASFLRQCETKIAFMDSLIIDPGCPVQLRDLILDSLVDRTIEVAIELKLKGIIAFTQRRRVIERAKKHGFVIRENDVVLSLDLEKI
jgi:hypothetical protein